MKNSKIIIGLLLLSVGLLIGQSITFNVTNFEGGPASGVEASWMFDADWTPFDYNNDYSSQYAYIGLQWNDDGHGDGSCAPGDPNQGSGVITSSAATEENLSLLDGVVGVMVYVDSFSLSSFEHINTVNSEGAWDTFGEAGDYRVYSDGIGEIRVNDEVKFKADSIVFYVTTHYPDPIGDGGVTGFATLVGEGNINIEESDPDWVAELDPNNTGLVSFESSSMSPTIQLCYGAYNTNLLVKTMDSEETSPTAEFSADITNGEEPLTVNFSDLSVVGNSDITSWFWDFGDDGTSVEQNPEYTYGSAGVYTVSLTVTDENGLSDVVMKEDYIMVTSPSDEDYFSFDYSGASMNGTFSVSGVPDSLSFPTEGVAGGHEVQDDSVYAVFSGVEVMTIDSVNIGFVYLKQPGELAPGDYSVDPLTQTALFGFVQGATVMLTPDSLGFPGDIDADKIYISGTGAITISEVTDSTVSGAFSGLMLNIENPLDMLTVTSGAFLVSMPEMLEINYQNGDLPTDFALMENYPNPFNPMTTIEYEIQRSGFVNLSVFDIQGREVSSLVNGYQSLGWHTINWDGSGFSSGIYLYRLTMDNEIITRKMLLTK